MNHRPWPIPDRAWRMKQTWKDLLFMHWPVARVMLEPLVPDELKIQEFDGSAWIGVVPFEMDNLAIRPFPPIPGLSAFPELNLRTYVEYDGKPGVWFLNLDASNSFAVWAARTFFNLPYYKAKMSVESLGSVIEYKSKRKNAESPVAFESTFRPTTDSQIASEGSLEEWLTKRYCLYAKSANNTLYRTEIHHLPWKLQGAEATIQRNELPKPFNIKLPDKKPHLLFSKSIEVVIWTPDKITSID